MTFEMLMEEKFEAGIEKGIAKGREEGIEQGAYNNKLETAKKLLEDNISPEVVVKYTGLPLETILKLKDRA
jgi:predicted transposase/invertase (TIGR01784 family)